MTTQSQQQIPYATMISSRFSVIAGTSSGPPSEAPSSEISSVDSFSDLRTIAAGLGIVEPEEIYVERFKIDRTKLEEMIKSRFILFLNFITILMSLYFC